MRQFRVEFNEKMAELKADSNVKDEDTWEETLSCVRLLLMSFVSLCVCVCVCVCVCACMSKAWFHASLIMKADVRWKVPKFGSNTVAHWRDYNLQNAGNKIISI